MTPFESEQAELSGLAVGDYLAILRRRWVLAASITAGILALGLLFVFLSPKEYQSSATVLLRTNTNQQLFPPVGASQRTQFIRDANAELQYAESTAFAAAAKAETPSGVTVTVATDRSDSRASELQFRARSTSPTASQVAALVWANTYLDSRSVAEQAEVVSTIAAVEGNIAALEEEKALLLEPLAPIEEALLEADDPDVISRLTTQRLSLRQSFEDELLPISLQLRTYSQDLAALRIASEAVARDNNSAMLTIEPGVGRQVAPNARRTMVLSAALAVVAALAAAITVDSFSRVVHDTDDLEALAPSLPVLARIPEFPKEVDAPIRLAADTASPYAQSFERIVSSLLYQRVGTSDKQLRVLFTSSVQSEGKTTVITHLAYRLTQSPSRTILIDSDLRRPDVHNALGLRQQGIGFGEVLRKGLSVREQLFRLKGAPQLRMLFAGSATDDAAMLLRESFDNAVAALGDDFDLLLVDGPPVLAVTDAEVMSRSVDAVVVVVRAGRTTTKQLAETLQKLRSAHAQIIGFVLVGAKQGSRAGYQNYYTYDASGANDPLPIVQLTLEPAADEAALDTSDSKKSEEKGPSSKELVGASSSGASAAQPQQRKSVAKRKADVAEDPKSEGLTDRGTSAETAEWMDDISFLDD